MPESAYQFAGYDKKTISIFEVIVAYFAGVFFNDIYSNAQASVAKKSEGKSLTDVYKTQVQAFVIGAKNDETCYRELIANLHKYFVAYYNMVSFPQFVDRVASQMVPPDYYEQLANAERDEILSSTVCDLVSGIAVFATEPNMLHRVIDSHGYQWQVTQRMLQDRGIMVLLAKRETLHNQFLRKIGQAQSSVPIGLVDDLKRVLRRLQREKVDEKLRADRAVRELRALQAKEAGYLKLIRLMRSGGAVGAGAALEAHLMPRQDRLAEADDPLDHKRHKGVPDEDDLAESRPAHRKERDRSSRHRDDRDDRDGRHGKARDRHESHRDRRRGSESEDSGSYESETASGSGEEDGAGSGSDGHQSGSDPEKGQHGGRRQRGGREKDSGHASHHAHHHASRSGGAKVGRDFFAQPRSSSGPSALVVAPGPGPSNGAGSRDVAAATSAANAGDPAAGTEDPDGDMEPVNMSLLTQKK